MATIRGSVGHGGKKYKEDVRRVQRMLNQHIQPSLNAPEPDGIAGPLTIRAIECFQQKRVKMQRPNGHVDPDGPMLESLCRQKRMDTLEPLPQPTPRQKGRPQGRHDPVVLDSASAAQLLDPRTRLVIGGIWGEVQSGETWRGTDGRRLVLTAGWSGVIDLLNTDGRIYLQSATGFMSEVASYPFFDAARRAAPMARLVDRHNVACCVPLTLL
jgi:hypothetical protein